MQQKGVGVGVELVYLTSIQSYIHMCKFYTAQRRKALMFSPLPCPPTLPPHTHTHTHTVVVEYLQSGSDDEEALAKLETDKCPQDVLRAIFAGMHTILQSALRQPKLKAEVRWCG